MRVPSYRRPYCKTCRTIWGAQSIGRVFVCQNGHPLVLKSFNPWLRTLYGCGFAAGTFAIMAIPHMPLIWIGGILFAPMYIWSGFKQWYQIKKLDEGSATSTELSTRAALRRFCTTTRRLFSPRNVILKVIICGRCSQKLRIPRTNKTIRVTCPACKHQVVVEAHSGRALMFPFDWLQRHRIAAAICVGLIASILIALGIAFRRASETRLAPYRLRTELLPRDGHAWTRLGDAYATEKRIPDAEKAFKKAISLGDSVGLYGLGRLYRENGRLSEAALCYEQAHAYKLAGDVYAQMGDQANAKRFYEKESPSVSPAPLRSQPGSAAPAIAKAEDILYPPSHFPRPATVASFPFQDLRLCLASETHYRRKRLFRSLFRIMASTTGSSFARLTKIPQSIYSFALAILRQSTLTLAIIRSLTRSEKHGEAIGNGSAAKPAISNAMHSSASISKAIMSMVILWSFTRSSMETLPPSRSIHLNFRSA
jgi:tetratricopeptide (TPR) repeat protein